MRITISSLRLPLPLPVLFLLGLMMTGCADLPGKPGVGFAPPARVFMVVQADTLNLRNCPDQSCPIMALLYRGETVAMRRQSGDWSEIETRSGGIGWVASRYLGAAQSGPGGQPSGQSIPPARPEEELAEPMTAPSRGIADEPAKPGMATGRDSLPPEISEEFGR